MDPPSRRRLALAGALTLLVVALGVGLAFAKAPSISLKAPHSVAAGAKYTIKVAGYFNNTKAQGGNKGANVAAVEQGKGTFKCNKKAIEHRHLVQVAGGPTDKKLRAKTPTTPGHFSATETVKAPKKGGSYTLCADLLNYPYGHVFSQMSTAHLTVNAPPQHTLTVSVTGPSGAGYVDDITHPIKGYGTEIDCGPGLDPHVAKCTHTYNAGATVKLEEVLENYNDTFAGWSGACAGTSQDCTVTMNADETVTATFTAP